MYKGLNSFRGYSEEDRIDWLQEVWSLVAMGFQLQELYLSHQLLNPWSWRELADALKWANKYAEVLEDSHWAISANCRGMRAHENKVHCGGHKAASCEECPQGHGSDWCHGDCEWMHGKC